MKYLTSYFIPCSAVIGLCAGGGWSWLTPAAVFLGVPLLDWLFGRDDSNLDPQQEEKARQSVLYSAILYSYLPIQVGIICLLGIAWSQEETPVVVRVGWVLSVILCTGGVGITVAHELIHRRSSTERWIGKWILMTVLYMHFAIEHVRGHHALVGTSDDPATARKGMNVYRFIVTTVPAQWISAWKLETLKLHKHRRGAFHYRNEMLLYLAIELGWIVFIGILFGIEFIPVLLLVAVLSFCLLEMINYIEHYGLERGKLSSGRYEPVNDHHSWNSNHRLSRMLLFELTRHTDHHLVASRPYQLLRNTDAGPQLPSGYPGMVLLTLVPPLWFAVMNPRVQRAQQQRVADSP